MEYTPAFSFSTDAVTYFPNAPAGTIPIFRASNSGSITVGANSTTTFNGVFEANGSLINWAGSGNKIFRNGILGSGDVMATATLSGDFIINGTTAELGGIGAINLSLSAGSVVNIGTGTTVTMISNKTIVGSVELTSTNSIIDVANFDLFVTGTVTNTDVSSYVRTMGTGRLSINNVDAIGKLFPVGNSTINPLYIQSNTSTVYSVRVVEPITPPIYNDLQAVLRTWYISSPSTTPSATISFGYSYPGDAGASYNNAGPVEIGVHIGTWNIHETGLTPQLFPLVPGTFVVTSTTLINYFNGSSTEFPFVIANDGAILSSDYFIACRSQKQNGNGIISWQVQDATTVKNFEVQRSVNGGNFQTIATVYPIVNQTTYSFTDQALAKGTSLYRIKVNRLGSGPRYSNTVAIINDSQGLFISSIQPNPVHTRAEIVLSSAKPSLASFIVFDLSGRPVRRWHSSIGEGTNYIQQDLGDLPSGVYYLSVSTNDSKATLKFVKQ